MVTYILICCTASMLDGIEGKADELLTDHVLLLHN